MEKAEFIVGYMGRSGYTDYTVEGDKVTTPLQSGRLWVRWALPCRCEEEGCDGWAMIQDGSQNWHKFQNGLTAMNFTEACAADEAIRKAMV